jgi:PPOX class probable F420-dependent enzyme
VSNLPTWAQRLIESARVARLGLIDDSGHPRVLPVTFAVVGDQAWTAVDQKPKRSPAAELARVRWLRHRPEATLLIDHYADDWSQLAWVQLIGRVTILTDAEPPPQLIAKYEPYRRQPPPGPLLRLDIERTVHWRAVPAPP